MNKEMTHVTRINLKTDSVDRRKLIEFCLANNSEQYVVIGWSYIYGENGNTSVFKDYRSFYYAVKDDVDRINHAFNVFWDVSEGSLFWTRDLEGRYWICRAKGEAKPHCDFDLDIGAKIPVEAYMVGLEVPGQIKASFNRPRGGICEDIYDETIVEFSKYIFNQKSGKEEYVYKCIEGNLLDNLPDFDLEELVIIYLQIKEDYYVLSNSIANKSTTIKIECELVSRSKSNFRKAVVQVKGKKGEVNAEDYLSYAQENYYIYLYAPQIYNIDKVKNCVEITRDDLMNFYRENRELLPESVTRWENLFGNV